MHDPFCKHPAFLARAIITLIKSHPSVGPTHHNHAHLDLSVAVGGDELGDVAEKFGRLYRHGSLQVGVTLDSYFPQKSYSNVKA